MRTLVLTGALLVSAVLTAPIAGAATPAMGTISPGDPPLMWTGDLVPVGANVSNTAGDQLCFPSYPGGPPDPGAAPVVNACDVFELTVNVPPGYWDANNGGIAVSIDWANSPNPGDEDDDFDMYIYKKPPLGEPVGNDIASSASGGTTFERTLVFEPDGTYLIRVNPFTVDNADFVGRIDFFTLDPRPTNVPGGVDQSRAAHTGYLSYSEPHISVDPLDPAHLVAGSKMYQNLAEYKFKIGTNFSFDAGQNWGDNGHLPGYPVQNGDEGDGYHITSDVWTAFDDEGNAYAMVLDSPPDQTPQLPSGWGMNVHKSTDGGKTWSDPIPIEKKSDPVTRELLLADKNTITVDNYGADGDGKTGNIYACWGEDAPVSNLSIRVSRSTDAGQTWFPGIPVSGADQSVIGCYVLVGPPDKPGEPGPLYVFWLDFGGDGAIRMAKSTNGGQTFSPPSTVAEIQQQPRQLPTSAFRNLSIPYAAVDPVNGTVYVTWGDYHKTVEGEECFPDPRAPADQVCDGDIVLVKSTDGGDTWSDPIRVNQDPVGNGADQFQPALAVTDHGQLNMMWFDRRNDPQNFYIDTYAARSNDGGQTWTETRVTTDMWDPSVNPPISPSGQFIGDYQGMAANDCFAYPFWQDTTLANLDPADPRYSPYQQTFSATIPNTEEFGGKPVQGVKCPSLEGGRHDKCVKVRNGTEAKDKMKGSNDSETMRGFGGGDRLKALGDDDCVFGNKGRDRIRDGKGKDKVRGGKGRDRLFGGPGKDLLVGGGAHDVIKARDHDEDEIRCGKGRDKVVADKKDDLQNCERVRLPK